MISDTLTTVGNSQQRDDVRDGPGPHCGAVDNNRAPKHGVPASSVPHELRSHRIAQRWTWEEDAAHSVAVLRCKPRLGYVARGGLIWRRAPSLVCAQVSQHSYMLRVSRWLDLALPRAIGAWAKPRIFVLRARWGCLDMIYSQPTHRLRRLQRMCVSDLVSQAILDPPNLVDNTCRHTQGGRPYTPLGLPQHMLLHCEYWEP